LKTNLDSAVFARRGHPLAVRTELQVSHTLVMTFVSVNTAFSSNIPNLEIKEKTTITNIYKNKYFLLAFVNNYSIPRVYRFPYNADKKFIDTIFVLDLSLFLKD